MKRFATIATILIMVMSVASTVLAQTDRFVGTWKLNVKKSKFVQGPTLKSETRIVSQGPFGMAVSVKTVNGDGSTQEFEYTADLQGKSNPMVGQGPYGANTIATNLTTPNTIQSTFSKANNVVATATSTVSNGGKVLTITTRGTDTNGKPLSMIAVYDKA